MKYLYKNLFFEFLLIMAVFMASCNKEPTVTVDPAPNIPNPAPGGGSNPAAITYLALGDSYTIGQGVFAEERFPAQTVKLLQMDNINITAPVYIATSGWTTSNLILAINNATLTPPYGVVTLLIGVNNQYQGRDTAEYHMQFTTLLVKAIELAGNRSNRVFVLSIPDYSVTPFVPNDLKFKVSTEIDWFNAINKEICQRYNISYTDITTSSREAATNPLLIAQDNLHPSGLEYAKWAAMLAPKIKAVL